MTVRASSAHGTGKKKRRSSPKRGRAWVERCGNSQMETFQSQHSKSSVGTAVESQAPDQHWAQIDTSLHRQVGFWKSMRSHWWCFVVRRVSKGNLFWFLELRSFFFELRCARHYNSGSHWTVLKLWLLDNGTGQKPTVNNRQTKKNYNQSLTNRGEKVKQASHGNLSRMWSMVS